VVLHEALEVEVCQLIRRLGLEESGQLGIGDDDATVGLVLKLIGADVVVDLLANSRARHLRSSGLSEEDGELITDQGGLDETRRGAVSRALGLLSGGLLGGLELAVDNLLQCLEVSLDGGEDAVELLELGIELRHLCGQR